MPRHSFRLEHLVVSIRYGMKGLLIVILFKAAKNLMNAVVLTVKASYVASTKYRKHDQSGQSIVMWKMKVCCKHNFRCIVVFSLYGSPFL